MKKNHFAKLINYIKSVYHIEDGLNKLTDKRVNPTYNTSQVITLALFGFLLRIRSFNELNNMIKENEFKKVLPKGYKTPKVDTIRDTLKVINIDGTKVFGSNIKYCDECLRTSKGGNTHYFHSGAVMSTIGEGSKLVLGFELYKPKED